MDIQISAALKRQLNRLLKSGAYDSVDALLREAINLLEQRDRHRGELRSKLQVGLDQLDSGDYLEFNADQLDSFIKAIPNRTTRRPRSR